MDVRKFYESVSKKLIHYLPTDSKFLKNLKFLNPSCQKDSACLPAISSCAEEVKKIDECIDINYVESEWRSYALEDISPCLDKATKDGITDCAAFWSEVLQLKRSCGDLKFPHLKPLVMVCLSLAHGNADTERSFSETNKILTKHRNSMNAELINGLMTVKTSFKVNGQDSATYVLSPSVKENCKTARSRYQQRIDNEKKKERLLQKKREMERKEEELTRALKQKQDEEKEKRDLQTREENLAKQKSEADTLTQKAQSLMKEANEALKGANKLRKKCEKEEKSVGNDKDKITKKTLKRLAEEKMPSHAPLKKFK